MSLAVSQSRRLPVVLAALVLLLAGCTQSPGVAAQVGDETITIRQLQDEVRVFTESLDQPLPADFDLASFQQELLTREINHILIGELADREGVEVSEAEVDELLDELEAQAEAQGGLDALRQQFRYTEEGLRRAALDELRLRQLEPVVGDIGPAIAELSDDIGVEVNPRYGTWEGASLTPGTGAIGVAESPDHQVENPG